MYAVIRTGGKQYKVQSGDVLAVEVLAGDTGDNVVFDEVLLVKTESETMVGTPLVAGATVEARILEQTRGPKISIFKKRRRKTFQKHQGHRQDLTRLVIEAIGGIKAVAKTAPAVPANETAAE